MSVKPLLPEQLYRSCDKELSAFKTTSELTPLNSPLGQDRAMAAVNFGINVDFDGYNIFCVGPEGTGKTNLIKRQISKTAKTLPSANDWAYINNFDSPHKPKAISLPAGLGAPFAADIKKLIEGLELILPATFESKDYKDRLKRIEEHFSKEREQYFNDLQCKSKSKKVSILRMPVGLVVAPMKDGEVISPEAFEKLPEDEKQDMLDELNTAQAELAAAVAEVPKWERQQKEEVSKLNEDIANFAISHLLDTLKEKYRTVKDASAFLRDLHKDIVANISLFMKQDNSSGAQPSTSEDGADAPASAPFPKSKAAPKFSESLARRYGVNVIVKHEPDEGAPVVFLDNPTLSNLIGRMERLQQAGSVIMDFNLLKAGALHEANGGFLILDAKYILAHAPAWEALKRAIRAKKIVLESTSDENNVVSTVTLNPQPIDLNIKVVLFGEPELYHTLMETDPEFSSLFKITAQFASTMDRTTGNVNKYARLIADLAKEKDLRGLNRAAVAKVIEYASRLASDKEKLSTQTSLISDLLKESDYQARINSSNIIGKNHIDMALAAKDKRSDSLKELMAEQVKRGIIMIATEGAVTGQINSLVVIDFAGYSFGRPSRVTCGVRMGKGDIIDIEREVELGGPTHSKGILILSSYLSSEFAKDTPLSLEASIVFEQSYGEVDGDSASSAELYALLSAIAEVPIRQDLAVTGSVNQFGQVQAVGGLNEKIEGFFDTCKAKGLTGTQGVIIPKSNLSNLMLKDEVLDAVKAGKFAIYPVSTIAEGIELLTGLPMGKPDKAGEYPMGSIGRKIKNRLLYFYQKSTSSGKNFYDKCDR